MKSIQQQIAYQRAYYSKVAPRFDDMNIVPADEHYFALATLEGLLDFLGCASLLDVGAGTGRTLRYFKKRKPQLQVRGIEPVRAMREQAYGLGISPTELTEGDATKLPFADGEFDVVTETGILHHIPRPEIAIAEMLRVARKAVFLSDSNNMGQGSAPVRRVKHILKALGLWKIAYRLAHGGKSYWISEGDGLAYASCLYDYYGLVRAQCQAVHIINTQDAAINHYHTASHIAMLGIKHGVKIDRVDN